MAVKIEVEISGLWYRVEFWQDSSISEDYAASIFRVKSG